MLGASIASFRSGLLHQGMWFLAALFWVPSVFIYAMLGYLRIYRILNNDGGIVDVLSLALATGLVSVQSRFLLIVIVLDWKNSHG
jgi:hypothetical protein